MIRLSYFLKMVMRLVFSVKRSNTHTLSLSLQHDKDINMNNWTITKIHIKCAQRPFFHFSKHTVRLIVAHDSRYIPNVDKDEPFHFTEWPLQWPMQSVTSFPLNIYTIISSPAFFLLPYTPKASMALVNVALRGFNPVSALNANYRVNPSKAINTHPFSSGRWVGGVKTSMMN